MSKLPKTVENIFLKYERLSNWKSGELEREICNSNIGKANHWTYQNVKCWVADNYVRFPNVAKIYVNSLYSPSDDTLPSELNHLRHLLEKNE